MSENNRSVKIGIIGDFNPQKPSHPETNSALEHAAQALSAEVAVEWIHTTELTADNASNRLSRYDGLFASPGFCENLAGALAGIRFARENGKPFAGT